MSDLGLLSHQYEELKTLARKLRRWATHIKRVYHRLPLPSPSESESSAEKPESLSEILTGLAHLTKFLKEVIGLKDKGAWPQEWISHPPLPVVIVERLREAHSNDLPLYSQQLTRLTDHLETGMDSLTETDLALIDNIVLAISADVNAVFRRMMRWS